MKTMLHFDCWRCVLEFLDEAGKCSLNATNREFHSTVMNFRKQTLLLSLTTDSSEPHSLPRFVQPLFCPEMTWTQTWSHRIGFRPASSVMGTDYVNTDQEGDTNRQLDSIGWDCQRPLHALEEQIVALIEDQGSILKELKIVDRRSIFSFWDSLSLHHIVVDRILMHCSSLRILHIEHLCLSSLLSFQNTGRQQQAGPQSARSLPQLSTLTLMDTEVDQDLMFKIATLAPELEHLHVNKFAHDITESDFERWFCLLPRLTDIQVGYSFKHGRRSHREAHCTTCAEFHHRTALEQAGHPSTSGRSRRFNICLRDNMATSVLDALLSACSKYSIHSLHVYGVMCGIDDLHNQAYNELAMDRIFLESISANGSSLRRLHLGTKVPLNMRHLEAICNKCQGLRELTLKTKLEEGGLKLVCAQLPELRRLGIYLNRPYNHGVTCAIRGSSFKNLRQLRHLEALQFLLYGDFYSTAWFENEFGPTASHGGLSDKALQGLVECPSLREIQFGATLASDLISGEKDHSSALAAKAPQPSYFFDDASTEEEKAGIREFSFAQWVQQQRYHGLASLVDVCAERQQQAHS